MKFQHLLTFLFLFITFSASAQQSEDTSQVQTIPPAQPGVAAIPLDNYRLSMENDRLVLTAGTASGRTAISLNGEEQPLVFQNGKASLDFSTDERGKLALLQGKQTGYRLYHLAKLDDGSFRVRRIPFWLSILPPVIAIALALIFKEVVVSLFAGVWTGAFIAGGLRIDSFYWFIESVLSVVQRYVINALTDSGHLSVIVFSLLIGGMVAIISRNGGMAGVVISLSKYARTPASSQFITWLLGVAIFFDDYANTLIVGNTMRSVTDKFKISREKLAYIVDSTAAPVSAVAFITTWIGAELGYIDTGLKLLDNFDSTATPYAIFLSSLKYSYYPALTLIFILMLIYFNRDFGTMYDAEVRARTTGRVAPTAGPDLEDNETENLDPVKGAPMKWHHAAIPVLVVIFVTLFGLIDTGMTGIYGQLTEKGIAVGSTAWGDVWPAMGALSGNDASFLMKIGTLIGASDSYTALLWSSFCGVLVAIVITISAGIMKLIPTIGSMATGFKAMLPALIILTLAWALATTTEELHTAVFLSNSLQGSINPYLMPVIVFVLAAVISFSTGSSWSTMAILYPIAIPTAWAICMAEGMDHDISMEILLNVISVTLGASVLGDHCSPISDTTILSSLASDCNHIDHVRTQMPYAMTVGLVSLILSGLSTYLGGNALVNFLLLIAGIAALAGVILKFGKKIPEVV